MNQRMTWIWVGTMMAAMTAGGCNTIKGVGKDIHDSTQHVQEWMENSKQNSDQVANADDYRRDSRGDYRNRY